MYLHVLLVLSSGLQYSFSNKICWTMIRESKIIGSLRACQTAIKFITGLTRASICMELHCKEKFCAGKAR